jgi:hypothetical protein
MPSRPAIARVNTQGLQAISAALRLLRSGAWCAAKKYALRLLRRALLRRALVRQHTQLDVGHIWPAGVLARAMAVDPVRSCADALWECCVSLAAVSRWAIKLR